MKKSKKKKFSKKAVSIMIGYVLLVSSAIVISGLVYAWMKWYIPTDKLECEEGASLMLKDYSCSSGNLNLTFKNNGLFDLGGYFIYSSINENHEIATINLLNNLSSSSKGIVSGTEGIILFDGWSLNDFKIDDEVTHTFSEVGDNIKFIEIIPIKYATVENKRKMVVCGNKKVRERVTCS